MTIVDWALYRDGVRSDAHDYRAALTSARDNGGFVWVGLHEPDAAQLAHLAADFGLHPLTVEDAGNPHERPKIEVVDDLLFTVLRTVSYVPHDEVTATSEIVETGEVMVFVGAYFVLTIRYGEHGALGPVRERLTADPDMLARGPSAVLYAIVDDVVDTYLDVAERFEDDLAAVEASVFAAEYRNDAEKIYRVKRELLELRRAAAPLGQPVRMLTQRPLHLVDAKVQTYFRDVGDHLDRVHDLLVGYDEMANSILQANLAQLSVAQNADMRKITSWAAIIAVPTAIAGVYGMNFDHMPELHWVVGYPGAVLLMALSCVALYFNFKRRNWL